MLIVDRFEGDKAVVFDGEEQLIISREAFNTSIREGDVVFKDKSGIYVSDKTATERRRQENLDLLKRILNKEKNG
ncbi:MAG: DUF3006 domain-containing protein [Ruminiclostridium sp.]